MLAVPTKESKSARRDAREVQSAGKVLTTSVQAFCNPATTLKRKTAMPVSKPLKKNSQAILIQPEDASVATSIGTADLRPIDGPPLQLREDAPCHRKHTVPRPQSHREGSSLLPRTKTTVKSYNLSQHRPVTHEDGVAAPPEDLQEDARRRLNHVILAEKEGLVSEAVRLSRRDDREGACPGEQRQHQGLSVQPSVTKALHHTPDQSQLAPGLREEKLANVGSPRSSKEMAMPNACSRALCS